jgi:short-subunit dehydrogenase
MYILYIESKKLAGKVAIVTGASSGIGEATAITLAKEGAKVALAARRLDKLEGVKNQIEQLGGTCICVKTDVSNRSEVTIIILEMIWFIMFNATFNNISIISWRSVLLVEETGENHQPVASH